MRIFLCTEQMTGSVRKFIRITNTQRSQESRILKKQYPRLSRNIIRSCQRSNAFCAVRSVRLRLQRLLQKKLSAISILRERNSKNRKSRIFACRRQGTRNRFTSVLQGYSVTENLESIRRSMRQDLTRSEVCCC